MSFFGVELSSSVVEEAPVEEEAIELVETVVQETNPAVIAMLEREGTFIPLAAKEPPAVAGPPKGSMKFNEDSEIAFCVNVFKFEGTVFADVWPQLVCMTVWCAIVTIVYNAEDLFYCNGDETNPGLSPYYCDKSGADDDDKADHQTPDWLRQNFWKTYGLPADVNPKVIDTVFFFLLVFVQSTAYGNFIEGRKQLGGMCNHARELAQNIYTFPLKDRDSSTVEQAEMLRKIIRRKLNLMFAFQRHVTRESNEGFTPGCGLDTGSGADDFVHKGDVASQNWYKDPCVPAIANLMTSAERDFYCSLGLGMRPAAVQSELNMLCGELSKVVRPSHAAKFLDAAVLNTEGIMNLFKGTARIVTTKMPMPYKHLLYVLNFIFCFLLPVVTVGKINGLYADRDQVGTSFFKYGAGWFTALLLTTVCYGILEIAASLQNPFGHDPVDHDMGMFAKRLHNETKWVGKAAGSNDSTDYTKAAEVAGEAL